LIRTRGVGGINITKSESSSASPVVTIPETLTLFGAPLEFQGEERGLI
jgi:hypothetical protein